MRVRLTAGDTATPLDHLLPIEGEVLFPDSNRAEWAIVLLDAPLSVNGITTEMPCLRPAIGDANVGDSRPISVHVSPVERVYQVEGRDVHKLGPLFGKLMCSGE